MVVYVFVIIIMYTFLSRHRS